MGAKEGSMIERHECQCEQRPACDPHGAMEWGGGEPDVCEPHGHLAEIEARDREVDTSPTWRGWETQHPVIAQLVRDRRALLDEIHRRG
jgi:hypothetical protein